MSETTRLLGRKDVAELLPMADCIEAVEAALRAQSRGEALPSVVAGLHAGAGGFHVKAAGLRAGRLYVATKINANFPENPARGLPTIQGVVVLSDGDDGQVLAVMDSIEITALRTGAATAVAARYAARPEARSLTVYGCGRQAAYQLRALAAVRELRSVRAWDVDRERASRFAREMSAETGLPVTAVEEPGQALRDSDMIVTCTPSRRPVIGPEDVKAGAFVAAVGADHPEKQEIDPLLLARARVVVDSLEQALAIGDLHHAVAAGLVSREAVHAELWELASGRKPGRLSEDDITVFDSTGIALEDVAAAALVYERAVEAGRGQDLDFGA